MRARHLAFVALLALGLVAAFAVLRGVGSPERTPRAPRAVESLLDAGRPFRVVRPPGQAVPEALGRALRSNLPAIRGERVPRTAVTRLVRERWGEGAEAWKLDLAHTAARSDARRLVIGGREIALFRSLPVEEPAWAIDGRGDALLVVPRGAGVPAGEIVVDYLLDTGAYAALDWDASERRGREFFVRAVSAGPTSTRGLRVPAPAAVALDARVPERPALRFALGMESAGGVRGDGAAALVLVDGQEVFRRALAPGVATAECSVDLSPFAGRAVELTFAADPGPDGDEIGDLVFFGDPRLVARGLAERPPDLVFVLIDTLRADHVSCYGYERATTPNLDRLAEQGVRCTNARAQSSWTRPSVASIFTSLYPSQHRILRESTTNVLTPDFTTLAEILQRDGYATASFSNNPHVGPAYGLDQGFGRVELQWDSEELTRGALEWIDANRDAPYFIYLHLADPHDPYAYHPEHDFLPGYEGEVYDFIEELWASRDEVLAGIAGCKTKDWTVRYRPVSEGELAKMIALYDGEIAYTDAKLGRVLDRVLGDDRRTVVCVTSDHGEEFLEHGGFFHGYTLYDEVLRVPLVFAAPGLEPRVVDAPIGHVDLLPTLLDLLGRPGAELYTGRSLAPLLQGSGPFAPSAQIAETGFRRPHRVAEVADGEKWILQTVAGEVEGYDLARDPDERDDRAPSASERAAEAKIALAEWVAAQERRFEPFFQGELPRAGPVDAQALRKLGYFESVDE